MTAIPQAERREISAYRIEEHINTGPKDYVHTGVVINLRKGLRQLIRYRNLADAPYIEADVITRCPITEIELGTGDYKYTRRFYRVAGDEFEGDYVTFEPGRYTEIKSFCHLHYHEKMLMLWNVYESWRMGGPYEGWTLEQVTI